MKIGLSGQKMYNTISQIFGCYSMRTKKEVDAFISGYETALNMVKKVLRDAHHIEGCEDVSMVLDSLVKSMEIKKSISIGYYIKK